jgi:dienelactone hydrolase
VGESTGDFASAATDDFAADARAGFDFLLGRADIDADRIGLIGHSDGAVIAPMLAAASQDVAWAVLMAGLRRHLLRRP